MINISDHFDIDMPSTSRGAFRTIPQHNNLEGWIGHALDPVGVLFDTLMEASINTDDPPSAGMQMSCFYGNIVF